MARNRSRRGSCDALVQRPTTSRGTDWSSMEGVIVATESIGLSELRALAHVLSRRIACALVAWPLTSGLGSSSMLALGMCAPSEQCSTETSHQRIMTSFNLFNRTRAKQMIRCASASRKTLLHVSWATLQARLRHA